jgi:hypothetical protein
MVLMKKFKTNVNIDNDQAPNDDLQFIRMHGLKPTNLLRAKIKELREIEEGAPDPKLLSAKLQRIAQQRDNLLKFIEDKNLTDEMLGQALLQ